MLWLLPLAYADIPAAARWLSSDDVGVGVYADGSLVNEAAGVGLLFDPDGPAGPIPLGNDLILDGDAYEVWSVEYTTADGDAAILNAGAESTSALPFAWEAPVYAPTSNWIHGATATADATFDAWIELSTEDDVLWLRIDVTAIGAISNLRFARAADPDPDVFVDGSQATDNDAGYSEGVAYARAVGPSTGKSLVLAVADGTSGVCTSCSWAEDVDAASQGPISGDLQLSVGANLGDVPAGSTTSITFVYALSADPEEALALAMTAATSLDHDGDGVDTPDDCDDQDDHVYPSAPEAADGVDNDCDGDVDEGTAATDDDGDGYTEAAGDCDDADAFVYPGAPGLGTAADADCDGIADDGWEADVPPDETGGTLRGIPLESNGCASSPSRPTCGWGWLAWALGLGAARRRRTT